MLFLPGKEVERGEHGGGDGWGVVERDRRAERDKWVERGRRVERGRWVEMAG